MTEGDSPTPRVLYIISSRGKGTGGHHFSLRDLAARLRGKVPLEIAAVAHRPPPALDGVPDTTFIPWAPWRVARTLGELLALIRRFQPTHLHSYDPLALQLARVLSVWTRLPLVHTQCGGPTARHNVPRAPDVVLFSEENRAGLTAHPRMRGCRLHLLPGRVNPIVPDQARIAALRARLEPVPGELILLRINRFVREYEPAMRQALALGAALRASGQAARVVMIGSVGDAQVSAGFLSLAERKEERLTVLHDAEFTQGAAALLPVADAVIGTGRGLMEAASLGRVVFAPVAGRVFPALLAPDTFEPLARANFSPRAELPAELSDDVMRQRALAALRSPAERAAAGAYAREQYLTRFDAGVSAAKHLEIYAGAEPWPLSGATEALADLGLNVALESWRRARRALIGAR